MSEPGPRVPQPPSVQPGGKTRSAPEGNAERKPSSERLDAVMELGAGQAKLLRFTEVGTRHVTGDLQGLERELDMEFHTMLTSSDMQVITTLAKMGDNREVITLGARGWGFVIEGTDRDLLTKAPIPHGGHYVRQDIVTAHCGGIIRDLPREQWDDRAFRRAWISDAARELTQPTTGPTIGPR